MNTYCVQTLRETLKKTHLWVIEALPPNCPQSEVQPLTELLIRAKQPWSLQAQGEDSSQICSISHPPIYYYLFFLQGSLISFSFFLASLGEYACVWEWMPELLLKRRKTEETSRTLRCYKHGLIPLCSCQWCFGPWAHGHGLVFRATYGAYIKFTVPSWEKAVFVNHLGEGRIYGRGKTHPVKPLNTGSVLFSVTRLWWKSSHLRLKRRECLYPFWNKLLVKIFLREQFPYSYPQKHKFMRSMIMGKG